METDVLYRPCPVRDVLLCSFALEGGAYSREARLDFGREGVSFALEGSRQPPSPRVYVARVQ